MQCWICGEASADTGEHMIKVTDLESLFGHTTTHKPLYRRIGSGRQEKAQGKNSPKLKFKTQLCAVCNNARTQPHDLSWQAFAAHLRTRQKPIAPGDVVRAAKAFNSGVRVGLLGVHLYFVKLFGCLIHDAGVPMDTSPLAAAIINNEPHPHIYLSFLAITNNKLQDYAHVTPVSTMNIGDDFSAQWIYTVGRIGVHVIYAPTIHLRNHRVHLWNPRFSTKTITLDRLGSMPG